MRQTLLLLQLNKGTYKVENPFISSLARNDHSRLLNLNLFTELLIMHKMEVGYYIRPKVGSWVHGSVMYHKSANYILPRYFHN